MLKSIGLLALAYLTIGVVWTVAFYLLTGVFQFGVDVFDFRELGAPPRLTHVPEIAVGFIGSRLVIGVVEAVVLAWYLRRSGSGFGLFVLGTGLPVLYEVLAARPYAHSWVGMAWAVLRTWPSVPEHVMPTHLVLRTATAYVAPAALTGMSLSLWLIFRRQSRRELPD